MKKIMVLVALVLTISLAHAQKLKETDLPAAVKDSFAKRFPQAKNVSWSKENDAEYEAEFKINGTEQSVNFDQAGKWLMTETEIKKSELPAAVQASIAKEFPGYKIEETEKTESAANGSFYEIEVEKGKVTYEVQISADGKVIKKEEEKEDKDGDDEKGDN
jgi:uncharacterized membrane protein YkoI